MKKNIFLLLFICCVQCLFSERRDTVFYKQYIYDHNNSDIDSFFIDTIALTENPMQMVCKSAVLDRTSGWLTSKKIGVYLETVNIEKTNYDEIGTDITFDSIYSIIENEDYILVTFYTLSLFDRCDFLFDMGYCEDLNEVQLRFYSYAIGDIQFYSYPIYKLTYKIGKGSNYTGRSSPKGPLNYKVYNLPQLVCY